MNVIFRSYIFDVLYTIADQLIKKYNPCQIYKDARGKAHCLRDLPCCGGCKFLGPDGCTTKCLGCKLGLCETAQNANLELYKLLFKMRHISWRCGLRGIRQSKKEIIDFCCRSNKDRVTRMYKNAMSNTIRDLKAALEKSGG